MQGFPCLSHLHASAAGTAGTAGTSGTSGAEDVVSGISTFTFPRVSLGGTSSADYRESAGLAGTVGATAFSGASGDETFGVDGLRHARASLT